MQTREGNELGTVHCCGNSVVITQIRSYLILALSRKGLHRESNHPKHDTVQSYHQLSFGFFGLRDKTVFFFGFIEKYTTYSHLELFNFRKNKLI